MPASIPIPLTGARAVPIYQTTSYMFPDVEHAASLFNLERAGHIYSRISNPTVAVLEERLAALEGGVGAICTASGMAAIHLAVATLMGQGGHIVSSGSIYGGTHNLFTHTLPRFGITATFVDPRDPAAFEAAIRPETRLVFGETLGNPGLEVMDLPVIGEIAHSHGIPVMIDSTFATPWLFRPLDHGCDIVMHSVTKFLGRARGGDRRRDYRRRHLRLGGLRPLPDADRALSPAITASDFADEFGPAAFIMRARAEGLRDFGAAMSPANAFYLLQGVESLPVRMARHVENTRKIVAFLDANPAVDWVSYPELPSHPDRDASPSACCRRAAARSSVSASRAGARRAAASSSGSACSPISPMSATPNPSSSIRPARRTSRWTPRR